MEEIMATLKLNENQVVVLSTVLKSYLSELRMEIADTDRKDFRDKLKDKKKTLMEILTELEALPKKKAA